MRRIASTIICYGEVQGTQRLFFVSVIASNRSNDKVNLMLRARHRGPLTAIRSLVAF
jgi:hypothetical protein